VRYPLRYKGVRAIGGVEPSTVESQSTVLPLHYDRQEGTAFWAVVAEMEGVEPPTACHAATR
jgi:hypothetical protein